ncbi:MAG: 2-oxoacid:acceptor oxidoreductase family protein [Candidatus Tectomicrobia bacterium]|nr:2-oxoacid:acceptor oxidoreductase family protein [Candidatus Tectomicrobia bacterium]
MITNVLVTGLSGSGILLFSRILADLLASKGYAISTKDCLGTAHRATLVITEIRYSADQEEFTNFIPYGGADLLVGFEPLETLRLGALYAKRGGRVIMNTRRVMPTFETLGRDIFSPEPRPLGYPETPWIIDYLRQLGAGVVAFDATARAEEVGHHMSMNVVMLGALAACGGLEVAAEEIETIVAQRAPKGSAERNLAAFRRGHAAALEALASPAAA